MGFKFAEIHSAAVTNGYSDGPLCLRRTVVPAMDRRMNLWFQVRLSVIFKLGHTRRNQRCTVTTETDRRRRIVASLMKRT